MNTPGNGGRLKSARDNRKPVSTKTEAHTICVVE